VVAPVLQQAPIFTVLIFAFLGALEGKSFEDIKQQLKNDYPDTIVANCKLVSTMTRLSLALGCMVL
jgi:Mpv17 / PMP22 family